MSEVAKLKLQIENLKRQVMVAERMRHEAVQDAKKLGGDRSPFDARLFAAGIAHEFNNILGAVDGHAEWALESGDSNDMREALGIIRQACARSSQITKGLQGLGQPQEERKERVHFESICKELKKISRPYCKNHSVKLKIDVTDASVYANAEKILEVLLNLVRNSVDAMAYTENFKSSKREIEITAKKQKKELLVWIQDTGPGVPEVFKDLIFQPFFTTKGTLSQAISESSEPTISDKKMTSGSGLGLYLCRSILEEHGGTLNLLNSKIGARFELRLPLFDSKKISSNP